MEALYSIIVTGSSGASLGVALGDVGVLAGHEAHDVVDLADALRPPAGRDAHALGHRVHAPRVDRVDHRVVGAVELDDRERERVVERVLLGRLGHPGPVGDGAGRAHLDEVGRELLAGLRIPLERRREHLVAVADARGSCVRTRPVMNAPNTGPSERLYGNWMRFSTSRGTVPPPNLSTMPAGLPGGRRKSRGAAPARSLRPDQRARAHESARAITRSSRAVTTRTRTRASGCGDVGVAARRRVGVVVDDRHPATRSAATARARISALCSPIPPVKTTASSPPSAPIIAPMPGDEPVHEDVDREPGPLVAARRARR